jgi:hypothetical protein
MCIYRHSRPRQGPPGRRLKLGKGRNQQATHCRRRTARSGGVGSTEEVRPRSRGAERLETPDARPTRTHKNGREAASRSASSQRPISASARWR